MKKKKRLARASLLLALPILFAAARHGARPRPAAPELYEPGLRDAPNDDDNSFSALYGNADLVCAPADCPRMKVAMLHALDELERTVDGLEKRTAAAEADLRQKRPRQPIVEAARQLAEDGENALKRFRGFSVSLDYMGADFAYAEEALPDPSPGSMRKRANATAVRLASVRDRLINLQQALDLPPSQPLDLATLLKGAPAKLKGIGKKLHLVKPDWAKAGSSALPQTQAVAAGGDAPAAPAQRPQPAPAKTLLDAPRLPPPSPSGSVVKPVLALSGPWEDKEITPEQSVEAMTASFEDLDRIRKMHKRGETIVVGDPNGRARLVFSQKENDCAIAAQQQILTAAGALPAGADPKQTEETLIREAWKGWFYNNDGTPPAYSGALLEAHEVMITKRRNAADQDLDAAVKTGKMIYVEVQANVLWNDLRFPGGHSIVITGAEVLKKDGEVLGYYINDSGSKPAVGGRLVPAAQLREAWHKDGRALVVPQ